MADDDWLTVVDIDSYIDRQFQMKGGRSHLMPTKAWQRLDAGEIKIKDMFPGALIATSLPDRSIAEVNVYKPHTISDRYEIIVSLEEPVKDFPSESLITQLMLVVG